MLGRNRSWRAAAPAATSEVTTVMPESSRKWRTSVSTLSHARCASGFSGRCAAIFACRFLRAGRGFAQRLDAAIQQQQLGSERGVRDIHRFRGADDEPQMQEGARFFHRIVDAHRRGRAQLGGQHGIIRHDFEAVGRDGDFTVRRGGHTSRLCIQGGGGLGRQMYRKSEVTHDALWELCALAPCRCL